MSQTLQLNKENLEEVPADLERIEQLTRELLVEIDEDPDREGLVRTPARVARSWKELTKGYHMDITEVLNDAIFQEEVDEMVVVTDIDFFSLCEHHLLPFFGKVHVGYIPDGHVLGLSKLPRLVEVFSRRLQLQERMNEQIARAIEEVIKPKGVAVVSEAKHLCMMMRGVQKTTANTVASAMRGVFRNDRKTRSEFMDFIHQGSNK